MMNNLQYLIELKQCAAVPYHFTKILHVSSKILRITLKVPKVLQITMPKKDLKNEICFENLICT